MSNMNKSAKGSMFDGLQIFGKTDAKFSMTQSMSTAQSGSRGAPSNRIPHSTSYNFDSPKSNSAVMRPPSSLPPASLPAMSSEQEEDMPPSQFSSLNISPPQQQQRGLPKSWQQSQSNHFNQGKSTPPREGKSTSTPPSREVKKQSSPSSIPPLPTVSFQNHPTSPPPLEDSPRSSSTSSDQDYFGRLEREVDEFAGQLETLASAPERSAAELDLDNLQSMLKCTSLRAVQRILAVQRKERNDVELKGKIETALKEDRYEDAESLKNAAAAESSGGGGVLQYQTPRQDKDTRDILTQLNSTRRSHVESLKSHCVELSEMGSRFKGVSKKVEIRCKSRVEKQRLELENASNALECRAKHISIDREYLEKLKGALATDRAAVDADYTAQLSYQEELLTGVRTEIGELEARLAKLRAEEGRILAEKNKLSVEKGDNEAQLARKADEIKRDSEKLHIKEMSIKAEEERIGERRKEFEALSGQITKITDTESAVTQRLSDLQSSVVEAISRHEEHVVGEVQSTLLPDDSLTAPASLVALFQQTAELEKELEDKNSSQFAATRAVVRADNEVVLAESELKALTSLKLEAVERQQYTEAARIVREEGDLADKVKSLAERKSELQKEKSELESEINRVQLVLKQVRLEAGAKQAEFDRECISKIIAHLETAVEALSGSCTGITSTLLKYDIAYMYNYLLLVRGRGVTVSMGEDLERQCREVNRDVGIELVEVEKQVDKLRGEIKAAIEGGQYEEAERLEVELGFLSKVL
eukprot:sb/3462346/